MLQVEGLKVLVVVEVILTTNFGAVSDCQCQMKFLALRKQSGPY